MHPVQIDTADHWRIEAWDHPLGEWPADHPYVETFWLPLLGPTSTLAVRRLARLCDHGPVDIPVGDLAASLGVGHRGGRQSQFRRSMARVCQFGLARFEGATVHAATKIPTLQRAQVRRLPEALSMIHDGYVRDFAPEQVRVLDGGAR